MSIVNPIIEKINKLLAMANDASTTEAEANLFMSKVQALLAAHNLSEADLKVEEVSPIDVTPSAVTVDTSWFAGLASLVGKTYFCKIYRKKTHVIGRTSLQTYYVFVGKEHNRLIAKSMFEYLMKTIKRLAKKCQTPKDNFEFQKGAAVRLGYRLSEEIKKMNANTFGEGGGLPALYNNELALVDEFLSGTKMKKGNKTTLNTSNSAFSAGYTAGGDVSLNKQVGASASEANYLLS
jgi:hypothetical protein